MGDLVDKEAKIADKEIEQNIALQASKQIKFKINVEDLLRAIIILGIIFGLSIINVFSSGIKYIKDHWPEYRCNPVIMPLAGQFGQDVAENFSFCIQNIQTSAMNDFLQPLNYTMTLLSETMGGLLDSIGFIRDMFNYIRNFIQMITGGIMGIFLNIMINFQVSLINLKDLMNKSAGLMGSQLHMIGGSQDTMNSAWNGPPGGMVRFLCFHGDTKIISNNKLITIKEVKEGDILKNGQQVYGIMKLHNLDLNNNIIEKLYEIPNSEDNSKVLISGNHLIYDKYLDKFVQAKNFYLAKLSNIKTTKLYCLITDNHTIPIGQFIYHDWEDNQGSKSKS